MSAPEILLRALQQLGAEQRRRRFNRDDLWRVYRAALPVEFSDGGRAGLADLLARLAALGHLRLPAAAGWDRSMQPPLPAWALLAVQAPPGLPKDHRTVAWPPELAYLVNEPRLKADILRDLLTLKRFLAEGGRHREPVPVRERSVELFGDEKRLDSLLRSQVFLRGSIGPELLRAYRVPVPIEWVPGPDDPGTATSLLVLENLHTYDSFRRWNARTGAYLGVVYGGGEAFAGMLEDLARIAVDLGALEIHYFGDLDDKGLKIPATAWPVLHARNIPLVAAERWYELLLHHADASASPKYPVDARVLAWMSPALRPRVEALLGAGRRLPQERIGLDVLRTLDA